MSINRYAKKRDGNEKEIITTLESIGCCVYRLDLPVDLVCCYRGITFLAEVKDDKGRFTKTQREFLETWPGKVYIFRAPEDVLRELT